MADVSFDVLEALDGFRSAGFSEAQARAVADQLQHVVSSRYGDLATKADLRATVAELRAEFAELRVELKKDNSDLRDELRRALSEQLRWTIATLVLLTSILFGAIKLL